MVLFKNEFSALIMSFCDKKIRKFWALEKLENMMKKECFFEEKTFSSFKIASLPNWEGAKYAGGSRPSCFSFAQNYKMLKVFR